MNETFETSRFIAVMALLIALGALLPFAFDTV